MSEVSKIEWCDGSLNFVIGCTKVSEGCANCYAEAYDKRNLIDSDRHWGKGVPRLGRVDEARKLALRLNRKAEREGRRMRMFANSLSDWLDPEWEDQWVVSMLDTMRMCPALDFLLLTKRPEEWGAYIGTARAVVHASGHRILADWLDKWVQGSPPSNVWVGASVENFSVAKRRIPDLLEIPAVVRFLSCEPLLEKVVFSSVYYELADRDPRRFLGRCFLHGIDWVIVGGESGAKARLFHADWARSIRDECVMARAAFFMKQMGGKRKPFADIPADLMRREFPEVKGGGDA